MKRFPAAAALLLLAACDKPSAPPPLTPDPPAATTPAGPEPGLDEGQRTRAAPADALIAFARGSELWTVKPDGSDPRLVLRLAGDIARPAWSPNRKWIAFSSSHRSDVNLYRRNLFIVRPDGSELRQVTPLPRSGLSLEGAPKGQVRGRAVLTLATGRMGAKDFDIAVYGRMTVGKTQEAGLFELHAPAGTTWIKVSGLHQGVRYSGVIMQPVQEGRSAELQRDIVLTPLGADLEADAPVWAPDGRSLLFVQRTPSVTGPPAAAGLHRIRIDGSGNVQVSAETGSAEAIALATDGALVKMRDGRLLKVGLDSRHTIEKRDVGIATPDAIAVGPDGAVAFTRMDDQLKSHIVVGDRAVLTLDRPVRALDFSPDGRSLAYAADAVHILDLATGASRKLADGTDPAWYGR